MHKSSNTCGTAIEQNKKKEEYKFFEVKIRPRVALQKKMFSLNSDLTKHKKELNHCYAISTKYV